MTFRYYTHFGRPVLSFVGPLVHMVMTDYLHEQIDDGRSKPGAGYFGLGRAPMPEDKAQRYKAGLYASGRARIPQPKVGEPPPAALGQAFAPWVRKNMAAGQDFPSKVLDAQQETQNDD